MTKSSILTPVIVSNWLGSTAFGIHKPLPASSGRCPGIPLQASTNNQSINQINLHWKSSPHLNLICLRLVWPTALPVSISLCLPIVRAGGPVYF